jgi:hypothetical protein
MGYGAMGCCRRHGCAIGTFLLDAFISFGLFNIFLKHGTNHSHRFKGWVKFDFFSQKVKPYDKTTRFPKGLHCQAQKGRRTLLIGGGGVGGDSVTWFCKPPSWISYSKTAVKFSAWQKPPVNSEVKRHALFGPDIETPQRAVGRSLLHLRFPQVLYDNLNLYLKEHFVPGS